MELEIKLLVAREDLDRVLRSDAVRRCAQGRPRRLELLSDYFDTPQLDLHRERLALRLRRRRAGWLQGLKGSAASAAGLTEREEYEWPVRSRRVDFGLLEATPYGPVFARRRVRASLRPVFTTRFVRRLQRLALAGGAQAELCADLGEIRAGARHAPVCEVEIELTGGAAQPLALFGFAAELLREIPFRLGALSKAERGYALVRRTPARAHKALPVALRPDWSRAEVLQAVARECLAQVHANEEGFLCSRDPEFLHQLRVGLRRLRAALAMPEDPPWREALGPLREEMRWLFSLLGPARNWDVFLSETLPPAIGHFGAEAGLAAVRARALRLRRRHVAAARAAVDGPRYAALLLAVGTLLHGRPPAEPECAAAPAGGFARAVLERRDRALRKCGAGLAGADAQQRHRARVAAKKLRYCAEFFEAIYPQKKVERYIESLAGLQDALGLANDAAVGAAMVGELGAAGRIDARGIGIVQGWVAAGEARAIARLPRAWKKFKACRPFWD